LRIDLQGAIANPTSRQDHIPAMADGNCYRRKLTMAQTFRMWNETARACDAYRTQNQRNKPVNKFHAAAAAILIGGAIAGAPMLAFAQTTPPATTPPATAPATTTPPAATTTPPATKPVAKRVRKPRPPSTQYSGHTDTGNGAAGAGGPAGTLPSTAATHNTKSAPVTNPRGQPGDASEAGGGAK